MAFFTSILYSIYFVSSELVGIFTCSILLYLLTSRKKCAELLKISPVTRILLLNLTIMDLLALIIHYPIYFITNHIVTWYFGSFMCMFVPFVATGSHTVSTFTLTAIAIQWYNSPAVKPQTKNPLTVKQFYWLLGVIWIMAILYSSQMFKIMNFDINEYQNSTYCIADYPSNYILLTFILTHAVPFLICAFTYTRIVSLIWCQTLENFNKNDLKTVKMMLISTTAFMFLFMPYNILVLVVFYFNEHFIYNMKHYIVIFNILSSLGQAHVFYKPVIYICVNDNFRKAFWRVLSRKSLSPELESKDDGDVVLESQMIERDQTV